MAPEDRLLTTDDVAQRMSVSVSAVRKWRAEGELPFVKLGSSVRFKMSDIESFIQKRTVQNVPNAS